MNIDFFTFKVKKILTAVNLFSYLKSLLAGRKYNQGTEVIDSRCLQNRNLRCFAVKGSVHQVASSSESGLTGPTPYLFSYIFSERDLEKHYFISEELSCSHFTFGRRHLKGKEIVLYFSKWKGVDLTGSWFLIKI